MRRTSTRPEQRLATALRRVGLVFETDAPLPIARRRADFLFEGQRVAVFLDGCFWHGCPDHTVAAKSHQDEWARKIKGNRERDGDTDTGLIQRGWVPIRI